MEYIRRITKVFMYAAVVFAAVILGRVQLAAASIDSQIEEIRIEGVTAELPQIESYCYFANEQQMNHLSVTYGEQQLNHVKVTPYLSSGNSCDYYILLDVSGSISRTNFEKMQDGVLDFQKKMTEYETLTVITFGNSVNVICQNITVNDDITQKIKDLQPTDNHTLLYEAISKTTKLADTKENATHRKVAIVMTDGADLADNSSTISEARTLLQKKNIPLYAMVIEKNNRGQANTYIQATGEFARSTGGVAVVFNAENAVGKLSGLLDGIHNAYVVSAQTANNRLSHTTMKYTLTTEDKNTQSVEMTAEYAVEDKIPPEAEVTKVSGNEIQVIFSENVLHAEKEKNYIVTLNDNLPLEVYTVCYEYRDRVIATLSFEDELQNGNYKIGFSNITDASQEENALVSECELNVIDGVTPSIWDKYHGAIVGGIVFLAVAGLGGAILVIVLRIRKRSAIVTVEGKAVLRDNTRVKHHVYVERKQKPQGRRIIFYIAGASTESRQINAEVIQSMIVGRSDMCDVYIDDPSLSRQHFAILDREDGFYIEDLKTTNGTLLNGRKIYTETKLSKGDKIQAGEMQLTVNW